MMAAMLVTAVISTGFQMYSSYAQGQQEAAMAKYNADVERQQAAQVENAAKAEAIRMEHEKSLFMGKMQAGFGATGLYGGSSLDTMAFTANQFELDMSNKIYNAQNQAENYRSKAGLYDMQASAAKNKAIMGMIGAGLKGIPSVLSAYGDLPSGEGSVWGGVGNMPEDQLG